MNEVQPNADFSQNLLRITTNVFTMGGFWKIIKIKNWVNDSNFFFLSIVSTSSRYLYQDGSHTNKNETNIN